MPGTCPPTPGCWPALLAPGDSPTRPRGAFFFKAVQSKVAAWFMLMPAPRATRQQRSWRLTHTCGGQVSQLRPSPLPRARGDPYWSWTQSAKTTPLPLHASRRSGEERLGAHPSAHQVLVAPQGLAPDPSSCRQRSRLRPYCCAGAWIWGTAGASSPPAGPERLGVGRRDTSCVVRLVPTASFTSAAFILKLN